MPHAQHCGDQAHVRHEAAHHAEAEARAGGGDLQAEHGNKLRWYTVIANDRIERLRWIMDHPDVLIGFSDAGAHLRNMAFYNFPLRMLLRVLEAQDEGTPFMTVGRAIHRCTAEIAGYLGIDGGLVHEGRPADIAIIDPAALRTGSRLTPRRYAGLCPER